MAVPSASDFNKWDGTKFSNTDWDQNVDKTVEILANGNYDLNVAQITASNYVGIPSDQFSTITAGENLSAGNFVRISGGQAYKADNSTSGGITAVVGVCNTTVSSGGTVKIDYGYYDGFSSLTVGTTYYVSTSGGITSTKPSSFVFEIGIAVSTTRINFLFNNKSSNLEVQNTAPSLTLSDINSGTSQTQSINFKTADGQYASINGNTTGTGIGNINFDANGNINFDANKLRFLDRRHLYTYDKTISASTTTDIIKIQSTSSGFHGAIITVSSVRKSGSGSVHSARKTFALRLYSGSVQITSTHDNIPQDSTFFNTIGTSISGGELTFTLRVAFQNTMTLTLDIDSYVPMTITNL